MLHAAHLQRQNLLVVHDPGHAVGHHPEILAAGQHSGDAQQLRQLLFGVAAPELVVPVVEEVVVQCSEPLLLPLRQILRCGGYERLVHARIARIFMEQPVDGQLHVVDFRGGIGECGIEVPGHAAAYAGGNLPDAEEAEDVVDAESVEIARHLLQPRLPPGVVVLGHLLPVIGREAPVLTVAAEVVGRCARG